MTTRTADAVVIGVGGMGAAALAALAARGLRVTGIEQHGLAHDLGSSHGESRVIRTAYYEDPRYVPLLQESFTRWRALEDECGEALYDARGCLNIGRRAHPHVAGVLASVAAHGLPHEVLSADELRARFPVFTPDDDEIGVFERDAGVLAPERCTRAFARRAVRDGAELVLRERVVDVRVGDGGAVVTTDHGKRRSARHLVVCAGPWWATQPFLRELGRALVVTRQVQCWFGARDPGPMPTFIQFLDDGRAYYGIPPFAGRGVKACRHGGGARTTADTVDRDVHAEDTDDVRAFLRAKLPRVDGEPEHTKVCLYTSSPDGHFVVGPHPAHPHVVVLAGFSGHGFKMASVMGEIAADLVERGATARDISLFDPRRVVGA